MLNIVLELEKNNLNPVLETFSTDSQNYVVPRESSEAVIARILQELSGRNGPVKAKIMLTASRCGETKLFNIKEIYYLESFRNLIGIFCEKDSFEFYGVLYKVEERIRKFGFFRINHSYLVSLAHIRSVRGGYVILDNGKEISIGRKYRSCFQDVLRRRGYIPLNRK